MSSDWPLVRLGDIISIKHGFAFKGEFFSDTATNNVLVTPGNFAIGGGFKDEKLKYYDGPIPIEYKLKAGDLVVTMTDLSKLADTLGYSALIPEYPERLYLHNQRIGLVDITSQVLDVFYLYFLMRSREYRHHVVSSATGSTVKHTSPSKITSFEFRLPPLEIQKSIGQALMRLEEKTANNQQINQTLEQMAQAIFKSWFVDFGPVKAKIAALKAGGSEDDALLAAMQAIAGSALFATDVADADAQTQLARLQTEHPEQYATLRATAELFPAGMQDSELGEIPEGWNASKLCDEFDVTMGQSPPGHTYNETGDGVPFFQGRRDFGVRYPSNRVYCTEPKRMAKAGDTLLSVRAPVGDTNLARTDCCIGRGIAALRHKSGCSSFTYYSVLQLGQALSSYDSEGTVFGSINQKNLNSLLVITPPKEILSVFSQIVGVTDSRIKSLSEEASTLAELRDTLLPKLLTGELKVRL